MSEETNNAAAPDDGLWLSISDIAREKNVDKAAISRKVAALEEAGRIEVRFGANRTKLVNLAQFDAEVGEVTDFAREQAARLGDDLLGDSRYRDARIKSAQYDALRKQIEMQKLVGSLVEISRVEEVIAQVGEEVKKPLEQVPLHADEIVAAASSGGAAAVRAKLREIIFHVRTQIAEALGTLDIRAKSGGATP
jgi:DNA-binding MarR family transcriptional regulator